MKQQHIAENLEATLVKLSVQILELDSRMERVEGKMVHPAQLTSTPASALNVRELRKGLHDGTTYYLKNESAAEGITARNQEGELLSPGVALADSGSELCFITPEEAARIGHPITPCRIPTVGFGGNLGESRGVATRAHYIVQDFYLAKQTSAFTYLLGRPFFNNKDSMAYLDAPLGEIVFRPDRFYGPAHLFITPCAYHMQAYCHVTTFGGSNACR